MRVYAVHVSKNENPRIRAKTNYKTGPAPYRYGVFCNRSNVQPNSRSTRAISRDTICFRHLVTIQQDKYILEKLKSVLVNGKAQQEAEQAASRDRG